MFKITDFILKREFIAKLNNKLSNLFEFDGKYSSLSDIPVKFKPAKHTHTIIDETSESGSAGFIDYKTINNLKSHIKECEPNSDYIWGDFSAQNNVNILGIIPFFTGKIPAGIIYQNAIWDSQEVNVNIDPFKHNVINVTNVHNLPLIEISLIMQNLSGFCSWNSSALEEIKRYIDYRRDYAWFIPITFKIAVPCREMNFDFFNRIKILNENIKRFIREDQIEFSVDRTSFLVNSNHDLYLMGSVGSANSIHLLHVIPYEALTVTLDRYELFITGEPRIITIQTILEIRPNLGSYHRLRVLNLS